MGGELLLRRCIQLVIHVQRDFVSPLAIHGFPPALSRMCSRSCFLARPAATSRFRWEYPVCPRPPGISSLRYQPATIPPETLPATARLPSAPALYPLAA